MYLKRHFVMKVTSSERAFRVEDGDCAYSRNFKHFSFTYKTESWFYQVRLLDVKKHSHWNKTRNYLQPCSTPQLNTL